MCSCQRTSRIFSLRITKSERSVPVKLFLQVVAHPNPPSLRFGAAFFASRKMVGVRGFEPRTLRLSSACSNQLSYTPNLTGLPSRSSQHFKLWCALNRPPSLRFGAAASLLLRCERRLVELRRFE